MPFYNLGIKYFTVQLYNINIIIIIKSLNASYSKYNKNPYRILNSKNSEMCIFN